MASLVSHAFGTSLLIVLIERRGSDIQAGYSLDVRVWVFSIGPGLGAATGFKPASRATPQADHPTSCEALSTPNSTRWAGKPRANKGRTRGGEHPRSGGLRCRCLSRRGRGPAGHPGQAAGEFGGQQRSPGSPGGQRLPRLRARRRGHPVALYPGGHRPGRVRKAVRVAGGPRRTPRSDVADPNVRSAVAAYAGMFSGGGP